MKPINVFFPLALFSLIILPLAGCVNTYPRISLMQPAEIEASIIRGQTTWNELF